MGVSPQQIPALRTFTLCEYAREALLTCIRHLDNTNERHNVLEVLKLASVVPDEWFTAVGEDVPVMNVSKDVGVLWPHVVTILEIVPHLDMNLRSKLQLFYDDNPLLMVDLSLLAYLATKRVSTEYMHKSLIMCLAANNHQISNRVAYNASIMKKWLHSTKTTDHGTCRSYAYGFPSGSFYMRKRPNSSPHACEVKDKW